MLRIFVHVYFRKGSSWQRLVRKVTQEPVDLSPPGPRKVVKITDERGIDQRQQLSVNSSSGPPVASVISVVTLLDSFKPSKLETKTHFIVI